MNTGGDAAEQVVRMSLEGMEVVARISGEGAKNLAVLLAAVLREEKKTSGKSRLSNMIRSGQELKVFTVQQKDIQKFAKEAKKYGVLYSILREKDNKDPNAEIDVIARANDASKISRIVERFNLNTVDKASVVRDMEIERNPQPAKTEKGPQSLQNSIKGNSKSNQEKASEGNRAPEKKPSVRKKLENFQKESQGLDIMPIGPSREPAKTKPSVKER